MIAAVNHALRELVHSTESGLQARPPFSITYGQRRRLRLPGNLALQIYFVKLNQHAC